VKNLTKKSLISIIASTLLIAVSGCGGGGSDSTAVIAPQGTTAAGGTASVSGSTATSGSGITASSAFKATSAITVDNTTAAILVVDSSGNGKFGDPTDTVLSSTVNTEGAFDFGAVKVNETGTTKAQLTVSKQGFAPYTSVITLTDGQSVSVIADAASTPLLTEVVNISSLRTAGTLSSSFLEIGTRNTSVGVSSYSTIRSLSEMKALADVPLDGDIETKTVIPLAALDDSVTSIKAETQSFDPTNEEDAAKFPGEFIGVGEPGQGEQRLVSVGFDYMALTDQNGNPIELDFKKLSASSKLLPQSVNYSTCLRTSIRTLYGSQLELFKKYGDDDNETEEFEIPLWYYNSSAGNWQFLGQAEVYQDSSFQLDYNASSSATTAYAKMCITENWGTHINLDYSLTPQKPLTVCVVAKDQDTNAISGLKVMAQQDTTRDYKYLNSDGKAQLALTAGGNINDYIFSYSGTLTGWNTTEVQSSDIVSGGEEGCDNTLNIEVVNPYSATLKVTVKELDGTVAASKYVRVYNYSSNDYFSKYAYTDENGVAEFKVKPNVDYGVEYKGETVDANVNGVVATPPEGADNGRITTVTLQEEEKTPEVSVYMYNNSISDASESVNFYVYASDANSDPISLKSLTLNNTELTEGTDYIVDRKYSYDGYEYFYASLNLTTVTLSAIQPLSLQAGEYSLEATYNDGKADGKDSQRFTVNKNRAPVISSVYLHKDTGEWTYINSNIKTGTYDISAYAYDPDATSVTLTYMLDNVGIEKDNVSLIAGEHTLVISASDNTLDSNKTFNFFVGNNAPKITSFGATSYSIDLASDNKTIELYAYASDKDGDTLSVLTTDGTITLNASYRGSNYFKSNAITIDANTTFSIYANDGDKNSTVKSLKVATYRANQAPVFTKELTAKEVAIGGSIEFECTATDPEGDDVSYEWYVDDVKQSETSTKFSKTFNTSAIISCSATDADTLEPKTVTSTASVTTYDPTAAGTLVVNTLPSAIVATHNKETLAVLETKTADANGKVTFSINGTDRTTFSISVGPDVSIPKETVFQATLSTMSRGLNDMCDSGDSESVPAACSSYDRDTFMAASSISNTFIDLLMTNSSLSASDVDTNSNGSVDATENYAFSLSQKDANEDGKLTWFEYNENTNITSVFYVNVPVREYDIELYVNGYEGEQYYEDGKEWTHTPSTINFSGFAESTRISIKGSSTYTNVDGNATISADYMFGGYEDIYAYTAKYVNENNATKYHLALNKTATDVTNIFLTPADFTLTGTEISFIVGVNQSMGINVEYNSQEIEYTSNMESRASLLNDSRFTYYISSGESVYDSVNNTSIWKSNSKYYGNGNLKTVYDIADYPNLNIDSSYAEDGTVSFSGSDLSKITYSSVNYYGYGSVQDGENTIYSNVNVTFNYTIVPTSVSMPVMKDVLPSIISASLPETMSSENSYVSLREFKGMSEVDFINAITANDYSIYSNGQRYIGFNLNRGVTASSTIKTEVKPKNVRPFSIGFEPRALFVK